VAVPATAVDRGAVLVAVLALVVQVARVAVPATAVVRGAVLALVVQAIVDLAAPATAVVRVDRAAVLALMVHVVRATTKATMVMAGDFPAAAGKQRAPLC
jgi:hypothetical protein